MSLQITQNFSSSFPRKRKSMDVAFCLMVREKATSMDFRFRGNDEVWIPAFAGMTRRAP
jgi:hypothetical protein